MVLHPVGPQPPPVYWRRRVFALAIVGVLAWFGLQACSGDDDKSSRDSATLDASDGESPLPSPSTSTTASAAARTSTTPAAAAVVPVACADRDVAVSVSTDARAYPAGTTPQFRLTVANVSRKVCRRDVGSLALELTVVSGPARVWTSDLCKPAGKSNVATLAPGQQVATVVAWPRVRRAANCSVKLAAAQPGTYVVTGRAGGAKSQKAVFALR